MSDQLTSFLVIVLLPAAAALAILRLMGVRFVTALMWGAVVMAVVSVLVWLTVGGVAH